MEKQRIDWLDTLKVLAIYFVVLGHCIHAHHQVNLYGVIYSFHMPLFFMISGFLDKKRERPLFHEFRYLMIPYLLLTLLYFPFYAVYNRHAPFITEYAMKILTGNAAWFIPALFFMKVLFVPFLQHYNRYVCLLFCLLSWLLAYIDYQQIGSFGFPHSILRFFPFFIIGYMLKRECVQLVVSWKIALGSLMSFVVVTKLGGYAEVIRFQDITYLLLFVIQASSGIVITTFVAQQITKKIGMKKPCRLIAEGTIFVYVFHFALLNPFNHLFFQAMGLTMDSKILPLLQIAEAVFIVVFFVKPIEMLKKRCSILIGK